MSASAHSKSRPVLRLTGSVVLCLLAVVPAVLAQQPGPPPEKEGKAELAFVSTGGNSSTQSISTAGEFTWRPPDWVLLGKAAFLRNESEDVVSAKSLATLARIARVLTPRLQVFGQHAYLRDRFAGIEHRNTIDVGLSYQVIQPARQQLRADVALEFLDEGRTADDDLTTAAGTAGFRYGFKVSDTSEFTDVFQLGVDFSEDGTWRFNQEAALTAKINAIFSLKVSNVVRFVNVPAIGFGSTDTVTAAALVMSF